MRTWAREIFLYSQGLERMLQLIESDGERAYTKLLEMIPLTEKEHRCWIAFLLAQLLRTPSFALRILPALKQHIKRENQCSWSIPEAFDRRTRRYFPTTISTQSSIG